MINLTSEMRTRVSLGMAMVAIVALASASEAQEKTRSDVRMPLVEFKENPFPSTYGPLPSAPTLENRTSH